MLDVEAGAFASLVTDDKIAPVVHGIEQAVALSFAEDREPGRIILVHALPRVTRAEMVRRIQLCVKIFRVLRGDLKWSIERILDSMPKYLRAELDGTAWEPEAKRQSWFGAARP